MTEHTKDETEHNIWPINSHQEASLSNLSGARETMVALVLRGEASKVAQECLDIRVAASTDAVDDLWVFDEADQDYPLSHAVRDARLGERGAPRGLQEDYRITLPERLHLGCKDVRYQRIVLPVCDGFAEVLEFPNDRL